MIIYILNILHKSINMKLNVSDAGYSLMNDARCISCFAGIKKNNTVEEINNKLANFFELIKKYNVSVNDTFDMLEEVIGNNNNKWIIDEVYNYNGKYNINELCLSRYVGEILYGNHGNNNSSVNVDDIYKQAVNLRRVILDCVFNKIKEDNKNNSVKKLYNAS